MWMIDVTFWFMSTKCLAHHGLHSPVLTSPFIRHPYRSRFSCPLPPACPSSPSIMFSAVRVNILPASLLPILTSLYLSSLLPSSRAYSWSFQSMPQQCSNLTVSVTGSDGKPPYRILILPFGPSPLANNIEARTILDIPFNGQESSVSFNLKYPENSQFVAVVCYFMFYVSCSFCFFVLLGMFSLFLLCDIFFFLFPSAPAVTGVPLWTVYFAIWSRQPRSTIDGTAILPTS